MPTYSDGGGGGGKFALRGNIFDISSDNILCLAVPVY